MEWTLANIDVLVGIIVGLATATGIIVKWVVAPIRRHWESTKAAFDEKIASIEADHERDVKYLERRIKDLSDDLETCRAERRYYEERWHNPPGFQV